MLAVSDCWKYAAIIAKGGYRRLDGPIPIKVRGEERLKEVRSSWKRQRELKGDYQRVAEGGEERLQKARGS